MAIPTPLIHYSDKPLECPRDTSDPGVDGNPNGLWVSVGDAWLVDQYERWREKRENSHGLGSAHYPRWFAHANHIFIADVHNILVITNEKEFKAFNDQYSEQRPMRASRGARGIPWAKVRKHYQGIIIAPHLDAMAFRANRGGWQLPVEESHWYHNWVVASGCLWDVSVIENIETSSVALPPY